MGPLPLPLLRAPSQTSVAKGHTRVPALSFLCQARIVLRSEVTCGSPAGPPYAVSEFKGTGTAQAGPLTKGFPRTNAHILH
eukprot:2571131-Amphidinium_carterae.1